MMANDPFETRLLGIILRWILILMVAFIGTLIAVFIFTVFYVAEVMLLETVAGVR